MPERLTMTKHIDRLTRYEADNVVRQLTGRYYDKYEVDNGERFTDFTAKLAWQIGGKNTEDFRDYLEEALVDLNSMDAVYGGGWSSDYRIQYESDFNTSINKALSAAGISGDWHNYYTQPTPTRTGLQPTPYGGMEDRAGFAALAKVVTR